MSRINLGDLILAFSRLPRALKARSEERRHRKLMRKTARVALAELAENTFGKVVGIARPSHKRLLEAPLSGRLCVYYEAYIDAMVDGSLLRTIASEQEGIAFVLEDGGARALVDPTDAFMSTGIDFVSTSTFYLADARQEALLRRHGLKIPASGKAVRFADGLRYREAIIEADERIAVFGAGVREIDRETDGSTEDRGADRVGGERVAGVSSATAAEGAPTMHGQPYRGEGAPTRLRLSGTSRFPLFISDDPRVTGAGK